jgi:hypothetical protein
MPCVRDEAKLNSLNIKRVYPMGTLFFCLVDANVVLIQTISR